MIDFGTKDKPLRASSLPLLVRCPWRAMILQLGLCENTSSKAADTGSAFHAGVHEWNKSGKVADAIKAMKSRLPEFPEADLADAELSLKPYCADPRNHPSKIIQSEIAIELELEHNIHIVGRLDQIREDGIWDLKHSSRPGFELLHDYAYQLAAYARGAGTGVGGIILPGGYRKRGAILPEASGVFWHALWSDAHIDALLDEVIEAVLTIRSGRYPAKPGPQCNYCPAGSYQECINLKVRQTK